MAADVTALGMTPDLGAEVRGVDLAAPISDACFRRIQEIYHGYCVIVLRDQHIEPPHLVRFAARFGELDLPQPTAEHLPGMPQVCVIGQNDRKDPPAVERAWEDAHWHSDRSYRRAPVATTLAYALQCPARGVSTEFVNMYAVYEALPPQRRAALEKLRAVHDRSYRDSAIYPSRPPMTLEPASEAPPVEHPLVRVHPVTGRKALFFARDVVSHIVGMKDGESRKLIDELTALAIQPRFHFVHQWRQGDLVIWDNRCTLHREAAGETAAARMLHQVWVKGEVPIAA